MESILNIDSAAALPASEPGPATAPRKKTMSPAALAANRANALKSTGPRTASGKLRSASNALQHGLYSPKSFEAFVHDQQITLELVTNLVDQLQPLTPTEHLLTQQIIHMQLRFLQMQSLYGQAIDLTVPDILSQPSPMLTQILRELSSLPRQIARTLRDLRTEQSNRAKHLEATIPICGIEPIPDQSPLPPSPPPVSGDNILAPPTTNDPVTLSANHFFDAFAARILERTGHLQSEIEETNPSPPGHLSPAA